MSNRTILSIITTTIAVIAGSLVIAYPLHADTVSIIGTGSVANALGPRFAEQGHTIIYGSRDPTAQKVKDLVAKSGKNAFATTNAEAAAKGEIVVLAVPWRVTEEVVKSLGDLSGKIIMDPTNPYRRTDDGFGERTVETSAGELIQSWLPDSHVVKAFNTLSATTMADPKISGGPVTIPLVGNSDVAKSRVAALVKSIGFETIDLGPIRYAHEVEGMLVVWINARLAGRGFDYNLRHTPKK